MLSLSSGVRRLSAVAVGTAMVVSLAACHAQSPAASSGDEATSASSAAAEGQSEGRAVSEPGEPQSAAIASGSASGVGLAPIGGDAWTAEGASVTFDQAALPDVAVLHNVRAAEHPDFYRVVVEFADGDSTEKRAAGDALGVNTAWADQPVTQGRGNVMPNAGVSFLDVQLVKTTTPYDPEHEKLYYAGPKNVTVGPIDVSVDGTFEGNSHVVIGMDSKRAYQVGVLESPTRVVIDIKK